MQLINNYAQLLIDRYNCGEHFLFPLSLKDNRDFAGFLALARHWGDGAIARSLHPGHLAADSCCQPSNSGRESL